MKKYEVVSPYVVFSVKAGAGRKEYALKKAMPSSYQRMTSRFVRW